MSEDFNLGHRVASTFKTFDYHSFKIESSLSIDLAKGSDMAKLICERYDIDCVDEDGVLDVFKVDLAVRRFVRDSFLAQKARVDKWERSDFGLAQFKGESWD